MREKIFNGIGIGLLALCFVVALTRIVLMNKGRTDDGRKQITLRLAHWQLENGPREAFEEMAKAYMKLNPHIRIEQIAIPERIYPNWLITQLVGETAPDLIEIGIGMTDELLARYFVPITPLVNQPNPHNRGTPLEKTPLRETFFDGMEGGYNQNLFEYYTAPISGVTIRMYYNLELLEAITGSRTLPRTYEELVSLCEKTRAYAEENQAPIVPIAGSRYNGPMLMNLLFSSQTQKLSERIVPPGLLEADPITAAGAYLRDQWDVETPEVRSGLELMRDVGQYMQPGFIQLMRDDATLLFVQKRAVMICSGSWDATSIRLQSGFDLGVGRIPFPSRDNPKYGKYTEGGLSEAGTNAGLGFGLTRNGPHQKEALDFLLFLASQRANQIWTDVSGWIPSVIGTRAGKEVEPFLPQAEGYLRGLQITIGGGFADTTRVFNTNFHLLVSPLGGVDAFTNAIRGQYPETLVSDLHRYVRTQRTLVQRGDTQLGALSWMASRQGENRILQQRFDTFLQADSFNQQQFYRARLLVEQEKSPQP